jgi:CRP-like cAMP-binding protein
MIYIMSSIVQDFRFTPRLVGKGRMLFRQGDRVSSIFLLESSEIHLVRRQRNGVTVILQRGQRGTILAEASLFAERYHCDAIAVDSANVRAIPRADILRRFENDIAFAKAWASHLAGEVRAARLQVEILACKTVSERLDIWFSQHGKLPEKGAWKNVAAMIGTSPEALYRELARRKY